VVDSSAWLLERKGVVSKGMCGVGIAGAVSVVGLEILNIRESREGNTMHKITIVGNAGSDGEMKITPSGESVTNFNLASNRRYTTVSGEKRDETMWFRVSTWGKLAEICNEHLIKGQLVYVEGRIRVASYTDRQGELKYSLEVTANEVNFLGAKPRVDAAAGGVVDGAGGHVYDAVKSAGHVPAEPASEQSEMEGMPYDLIER